MLLTPYILFTCVVRSLHVFYVVYMCLTFCTRIVGTCILHEAPGADGLVPERHYDIGI